MKINNDALPFLRNFGFHCEEKTADGFLRYQKTIGAMMVTVCNGQFENKLRISLLLDQENHVRASYKDFLEYTELLEQLMIAGLTGEDTNVQVPELEPEIDEMENPLIAFPKKPSGFMAL